MLIYTQLKDFLYLYLSIILTYILYINSEEKDILDYILHERVGGLNWFHIPVEMNNQKHHLYYVNLNSYIIIRNKLENGIKRE